MTTIPCIVSDSLIWNRDKFTIDLINAAPQGPVVVDMKREGPCCHSINLDWLLQSIPGLEVLGLFVLSSALF